MLQPLRHLLSSKSIILASASPRRKEICERNLVGFIDPYYWRKTHP